MDGRNIMHLGFLHKGEAIDRSTTFVIDPHEHGEFDLDVDVTIPPSNPGEAPFRRRSVIQIRYLPTIVGNGCEELLDDINRHCDLVRRQRGNTGARAGNGDLGVMHPIGSHITKCWKNVPYVTSASEGAVPILSKAVRAVAKLASVCIPAALRVIQDFENDSGLEHVLGMDGGICRVAHSMDVSINLANSSHYDSNDASQGLTIWTEEYPGTTKDWYFVLPNMRGKFPGTDREYNGIAIKLSHGVLIGWDGRLMRHGTSDQCLVLALETSMETFSLQRHGSSSTGCPSCQRLSSLISPAMFMQVYRISSLSKMNLSIPSAWDGAVINHRGLVETRRPLLLFGDNEDIRVRIGTLEDKAQANNCF